MNKIGFIVPSYFKENKGGAELQCLYLSEELISRDYEVVYIKESKKPSKHPYLDVNGIKIYEIQKRANYLRIFNYFQIKRIIKSEGIKYWYLRATIAYVFPVYKISKNINITTIWACARDDELDHSISKKKFKFFGNILYRLNIFLFKKALPGINQILLQTKIQKKLLTNRYQLSGNIVYNSIAIKNYKMSIKKNRILWIGRLIPMKQPESFLKLCESMPNYEFILVGKPVSNNHYSDIKSICSDFDNLTYYQNLPHDEILSLISESKLLINTSKLSGEGFSNTFLESWSLGNPVISMNVDPDSSIEENNLGIVTDNVAEIKDYINKIFSDDSYYNFISSNCIKYVETNHSVKNNVDKLLGILNNE